MKVTKDTIARTIVLAVALVNQILTVWGKNPLPFSDEAIYEIVTVLLTAVASAWAWWKNNSFTSHAIAADEYLKTLKNVSASTDKKNN